MRIWRDYEGAPIHYGDKIILHADVRDANMMFGFRWEVLNEVTRAWEPVGDRDHYDFILDEENAVKTYRLVAVALDVPGEVASEPYRLPEVKVEEEEADELLEEVTSDEPAEEEPAKEEDPAEAPELIPVITLHDADIRLAADGRAAA